MPADGHDHGFLYWLTHLACLHKRGESIIESYGRNGGLRSVSVLSSLSVLSIHIIASIGTANCKHCSPLIPPILRSFDVPDVSAACSVSKIERKNHCSHVNVHESHPRSR